MAYALGALRTGERAGGWTLAPRAKVAPSGVPRVYASRVAKSMAMQLFLIVLFIEVVFLTEKLNYILKTAIDHKVQALHVGLLVLYTAPQISDLALPIALMIAVYRVALTAREDREFLVFSSMGIGAHQFLKLALGVGVIAMLVSLVISGIIDPRAQFAHRAVLFEAQHHALRGGITPGQFYFFSNNTVFAGPQAVETPERRLFVHQNNNATQRVIAAARARLGEPDDEGRIKLHLYDITAQDFRAGPVEPPGGGEPTGYSSEPVANIRIGKFERELVLDELLRFEPPGRSPSEWSTWQLLGLSAPPVAATRAHLAETGRRIGRALMCLIAPLVAGVALALTTRATQGFILPAACAIVMGFDLAASGAADLLARWGLGGVLVSLIAVAVLFAALMMFLAARWQHAIVKPALARA